MKLRDRVRRVFSEDGIENDVPESVREAENEIERHRAAKSVLSDKLFITGYVLGDATLGRLPLRKSSATEVKQ